VDVFPHKDCGLENNSLPNWQPVENSVELTLRGDRIEPLTPNESQRSALTAAAFSGHQLFQSVWRCSNPMYECLHASPQSVLCRRPWHCSWLAQLVEIRLGNSSCHV